MVHVQLIVLVIALLLFVYEVIVVIVVVLAIMDGELVLGIVIVMNKIESAESSRPSVVLLQEHVLAELFVFVDHNVFKALLWLLVVGVIVRLSIVVHGRLLFLRVVSVLADGVSLLCARVDADWQGWIERRAICEKVCQRVWESDGSLCDICFLVFCPLVTIPVLCGELRIESRKQE